MSSDPAAPVADTRTSVFLSYARADRARVAKLAAALEAAGLTVWWDHLLEGGAEFAKSIRTALDAADAVIVIWSRASVDSDWVRDEAAQGRARRRLIPLSLDGSEPPLGFQQYHAIDVRKWRGRPDAPEVAAILRAVARAVDAPAPSAAAAPIVSRRRTLQLGAGAGILALGGGGFLAWKRGLFDFHTAADSIAVMPFRNLSGDPAQAFLSDGLTEEIRAALARNDALKVLAATSSDAAHGEGADAISIARRLGVAYILDGAVQRSNDVVRISANLTDRTGFSRWSNTIDRKLSDIFAVQTELAGTVAEALSVQMATTEPAPGGTHDVAAYEAFLRGRGLFNAVRDEATDRAALAQFDLAVATDPNFALAHAARSRSLGAIAGEYAKAGDLRALYDAAIAAARRAIAIAPDLAEAQLALGYVLFTGRLDVAGARGPFDRARSLGNGDADVLVLVALYYARAGRASEAQGTIARALALDPLNSRTFRAAGSIDYAARRYAAALVPLKRALALNPAISNVRSLIGNCLYQLGRLSEARAAFDAEPHAIFRYTGLAMVDHRLGDEAKARTWMARILAEVGDSALYQQAEILAQSGQPDAALATLAHARAVGDSGLIYLTTDPMLDPLRARPDFRRLLVALRLA